MKSQMSHLGSSSSVLDFMSCQAVAGQTYSWGDVVQPCSISEPYEACFVLWLMLAWLSSIRLTRLQSHEP